MTFDVSIPAKWTHFFIILFASGYMRVDCTACSDKANLYSIPVVRFCTDDTASGNPVVMDGLFADSLPDINICKCVAQTTKHEVTFTFENSFDISPIQNLSDCGSTVTFTQPNFIQNSKACTIDGSMTKNTGNEDLDIYLRRDSPYGNRSYCFRLYVDSGYVMKVSCIQVVSKTTVDDKHSITPTTGQVHETVTSEDNVFTSTLREDGGIVELSSGQTNDVSKWSTPAMQDISEQKNAQKSEAIYIGIGCAIVVVCLTIFGVILFQKVRKNSKRSQTTYDDLHVADNNTSHYNSLSVLSDNNYQQHQYENSLNDSNSIANVVENSYYEMDFKNTQN